MAKKPLPRIVRPREVAHRVGVCADTLMDMEKAGTFPRRIRVGKRCTGWLEAEVTEWIEKRAATHRVGVDA